MTKHKIENIIVHCSDSLWGCAREIRKWHLQRGWRDIGYHLVIDNGKPTYSFLKHNKEIPILNGSIECGRDLDDDLFIEGEEIGAHALGYNSFSIGICLIGTTTPTFTNNQLISLDLLIRNLMTLYEIPYTNVIGHYETASGKAQGKTCPNIDMENFREGLKINIDNGE